MEEIGKTTILGKLMNWGKLETLKNRKIGYSNQLGKWLVTITSYIMQTVSNQLVIITSVSHALDSFLPIYWKQNLSAWSVLFVPSQNRLYGL